MSLPHFLIVGAQKSGTSTLKRYLARHENLFLAGPGELHFFSEKWDRGVQWYRKQFREAEEGQKRGEKSPSYSIAPEVPERIKRVIPEVKLIWSFRDPVERAYSHYWHAVRVGGEPLSFTDALKRESEGESRKGERYMERGHYAEQVRRFLEHFDRSQMAFTLFEELISGPEEVLEEVFPFLGVDRFTSVARPPIHANKSFALRSPGVQYVARRLFGRGRLPFRVIKHLNQRSTPGYPPMPQEARHYLEDYFGDHNQRLSELTGLDLSAWQNDE